MDAPKVAVWEGVVWTKESEDKSIGLPFRCDGCEAMVHEATTYIGDNKEVARWCSECVKIVS
jgi:hypothetical protein